MKRDVRVLLVEDDPSARVLLAGLLSSMGCSVTSAASGPEALRHLNSTASCDVVISDVVMPGMSGIELANVTRKARPGLPVMLITGRDEGIESALDAGTIAVTKPVNRERLEGILEELLSR